ncbi:MAG: 30S ribosomal protein S15 [Nitrososphaerota archaeon]
MARMHSAKHGRSGSTRPISRIPPSWVRLTSEEVEGLAVKLAKEGVPPSRIGVILRDQYSVPLVKMVTGKKLVKILRENNLSPPIPEDLASLIERGRRMKRHLSTHTSDGHNIHRLQLVESKIRRLVKYYKREGIIPENFEPQLA